MKPQTVQPFYFPTTVNFIDDSARFLSNISLQVKPELAFQLYDSPFVALTAINHSTNPPPYDSYLFSLYRNYEDGNHTNHIIQLSLDKIYREIHNEHRFENVSVVVVDYDMPEMNGLEFCQQLNNPSIKKILLTGKADELTAINAFNKKTIDRFIRKQDSNIITLLNETIAELQKEYFQDLEYMLSGVLSVGSHLFLSNPVFVECFQKIQQQLNIVEHYLTCGPNGLLMLDSMGIPYLLIVQDNNTLQEIYEIAFDQAAPTDLLTQLRSGRSLPYFWQTNGHYASIYKETWKNYLYPATKLNNADGYIYTIIKNPNGFNVKYLKSYNDYLNQLDMISTHSL